MDISGQFQVHVALIPGKQPTVSAVQKVGLQSHLDFFGEEFFSATGNRIPTPGSPSSYNIRHYPGSLISDIIV
jgi:hypothetical protein